MKNFIFFANGFEEIEALSVVDILRRAELDVRLVSLNHTTEVMGAHGVKILCNNILSEINPAEANFLILPGGMPGAANLAESILLADILTKHHRAGKPLAAICAAPLVLGRLGLLAGKTATCYPGFECELHGANVVSDGVVVSDNIITGKGPAYAADFALAIVAKTCGSDTAQTIRSGMLFD